MLFEEETAAPTAYITLDGSSLNCDELELLAKRKALIKLHLTSIEKVNKSRKMLDDIVAENRVVYGVSTGFGAFANTCIKPDDLKKLQDNLIRSHAAGVGAPLPPHRVRALLALRINVLAKGFSGISMDTLQKYIDAFNASCLSWVPEQGTVGASGDLAPLSHLALGLMGEGKMWSPKSGWAEAKQVLEANRLHPISLQAKEGLALINGTQFMTALTSEAVVRAEMIAKQADIIAALTLEVLKGTTTALDKDIHQIRPHKGQNLVAKRMRAVLNSDVHPSPLWNDHGYRGRVQDAYSLRCIPQVHGIANDSIAFVKSLIEVEMNSATDNPIVLPDRQQILSGGNFHGEYPAKAADFLAIGVHELSNISYSRIERLLNKHYSNGLPCFLVREEDGGLNNGFMIAQYTAAALVSENKSLCHPASVDSLSTSAGSEDHVSMGGWAARKALKVVENVERVLAIELLSACQALDLHRPLTTTEPLEEVYKVVRQQVQHWQTDRFMAPDIDAATKLLYNGKVWSAVEQYINRYNEIIQA